MPHSPCRHALSCRALPSRVDGNQATDLLGGEHDRKTILLSDAADVVPSPAEPWGTQVTAVEIKDITLPDNMQRAMAKEAEAERERRAKIVATEERVGNIMARTDKSRAPALAYLRTSSAANVGTDKDSEKRQRHAIQGFAKRAGFGIVDEFYDAAVSGADPIETRAGIAPRKL